jgi:hypothetical protein
VFKTAAEGAVLVVIFLLLPEGLFGRLALWLGRSAARKPPSPAGAKS